MSITGRFWVSTEDLHRDAIALDDHGEPPTGDTGDREEEPKVVFEAFVGIGPRRYFDLFSMKLSNGYPLKRKAGGNKVAWSVNSDQVTRVPMLPTSYLDREAQLAKVVTTLLEETP